MHRSLARGGAALMLIFAPLGAAAGDTAEAEAAEAPIHIAAVRGGAAAALPDTKETPVPAQAPEFTLRDQFNDTHEYAFPAEKPQLLWVADRHGAWDVLDWFFPLEKAFGEEIGYNAVGALGRAPRILAPFIRHVLRREVPRPILLDWRDDIAEAYAFKAEISNLFVISTSGEVLLRIDGKATPEGLEVVKTLLRDLLGIEEDREGE